MYRFLLILSLLVCACGGRTGDNHQNQQTAHSEKIRLDAESMAPRAALVRAELTTEVDEERYRPIAPPANNFPVEQPEIYLVGKLKDVPDSSIIEIKWFIDSSTQPLFVSSVTGSDRYQFVASFRPSERKFIRGSYAARIYVNDQEVGAVPFVIQDVSAEQTGVRIQDIKFSKKVRKKEKPVKPSVAFPKGTEKIYASFGVKGADFNDVIEIHWFHGGKSFHSERITYTGDKRYSTYILSSPSLPMGEYRVELSLGPAVLGTKSFQVGEITVGPTVDEITLGNQLDENNMPQKSSKWLRRKDEIIYCGLSFVDLKPESMLEIEWARVIRRESTVLAKQKTVIQSGGTGSFGISWEPDTPLEKGKYKVTVLIDGEPGGEKEFEVR